MLSIVQRFVCEENDGYTTDSFYNEASAIMREKLAALAPAIVPDDAALNENNAFHGSSNATFFANIYKRLNTLRTCDTTKSSSIAVDSVTLRQFFERKQQTEEDLARLLEEDFTMLTKDEAKITVLVKFVDDRVRPVVLDLLPCAIRWVLACTEAHGDSFSIIRDCYALNELQTLTRLLLACSLHGTQPSDANSFVREAMDVMLAIDRAYSTWASKSNQKKAFIVMRYDVWAAFLMIAGTKEMSDALLSVVNTNHRYDLLYADAVIVVTAVQSCSKTCSFALLKGWKNLSWKSLSLALKEGAQQHYCRLMLKSIQRIILSSPLQDLQDYIHSVGISFVKSMIILFERAPDCSEQWMKYDFRNTSQPGDLFATLFWLFKFAEEDGLPTMLSFVRAFADCSTVSANFVHKAILCQDRQPRTVSDVLSWNEFWRVLTSFVSTNSSVAVPDVVAILRCASSVIGHSTLAQKYYSVTPGVENLAMLCPLLATASRLPQHMDLRMAVFDLCDAFLNCKRLNRPVLTALCDSGFFSSENAVFQSILEGGCFDAMGRVFIDLLARFCTSMPSFESLLSTEVNSVLEQVFGGIETRIFESDETKILTYSAGFKLCASFASNNRDSLRSWACMDAVQCAVKLFLEFIAVEDVASGILSDANNPLYTIVREATAWCLYFTKKALSEWPEFRREICGMPSFYMVIFNVLNECNTRSHCPVAAGASAAALLLATMTECGDSFVNCMYGGPDSVLPAAQSGVTKAFRNLCVNPRDVVALGIAHDVLVAISQSYQFVRVPSFYHLLLCHSTESRHGEMFSMTFVDDGDVHELLCSLFEIGVSPLLRQQQPDSVAAASLALCYLNKCLDDNFMAPTATGFLFNMLSKNSYALHCLAQIISIPYGVSVSQEVEDQPGMLVGEKYAASAMITIGHYIVQCIAHKASLFQLSTELVSASVLEKSLIRLLLKSKVTPVLLDLHELNITDDKSSRTALERYRLVLEDTVSVLNVDAILADYSEYLKTDEEKASLRERVCQTNIYLYNVCVQREAVAAWNSLSSVLLSALSPLLSCIEQIEMYSRLIRIASAAVIREDLDAIVAETVSSALRWLCNGYEVATSEFDEPNACIEEIMKQDVFIGIELPSLLEAFASCALRKHDDDNALLFRNNLYEVIHSLLRQERTLEEKQNVQKQADRDEKNLCEMDSFLELVLRDSLYDTLPSTQFAIRFIRDIAMPYIIANRKMSKVFFQYLQDSAVSVVVLSEELPKTSGSQHQDFETFFAMRLDLLEHLAETVSGTDMCLKYVIPEFTKDLHLNNSVNGKPLYYLLAKIAENILNDADLPQITSCVDAACMDDMIQTLTSAAPRSKSVAPLVALASTGYPSKEGDATEEGQEVDLEKLSSILYLISVLAQRTGYIASSIRPGDQLMRTAILQLFLKFCVDVDGVAASMSVDSLIILEISESITSFLVSIVKDGNNALFVLPDENEAEENANDSADISVVDLVDFTCYALSSYVECQKGSSSYEKRMKHLETLCVNGLTLINSQAQTWKKQKPLSRLFWDILDHKRFSNELHKAEKASPICSTLGGLIHSVIVLLNTNKRPATA